MRTMRDDPIRYWQSLTTRDVPAAVARDPVVILPLAAIEQHGPHLPLSPISTSDWACSRGIRRTGGRLSGVDASAAGTGASQEHLRFAGTLSLRATLLSDLIEQQGAALAACGSGGSS